MPRRCAMCGDPTVELKETKGLRLGIQEQAFECTSCHQSFKTFNPTGHKIWWGLVTVLNVAFVVGAASGRIAEGQTFGVVAFMLVLDAFLVGLGLRAWRNDRRNPPVG